MGGILKNRQEQDSDVRITDSTKEFREQVLKNTKLNALLKGEQINSSNNFNNDNNNNNENTINNGININSDEKLQWNKQNLSENEIIQKNIIENLSQTIDEPKTPFQKATQPELNEYYQDDDDEVKDLEDFSLGEPEFNTDELDKLDDLNKSKIIESDIPNINDEQENDEHNNERKKSFEELRKEHYHHEHYPVVHPTLKVDNDADDEDEEEEEEQPKPKKSFAELRKLHYSNEVPKNRFEDDDDDDE